jgi:serine/threonine protein kinase
MKNKSDTLIDLKKVNDLSSFSEVYIGSQYKILINKKLGSGSFGDIYLGLNLKTKEEVAIKLELADSRTPQLNYESKILKFLQGGEGFPIVQFFGIVGIFNVMIIDLLGPTLEDQFNKCNRHFSLKTVLMLALQMLNRIEFLHSRHFIHRDIKPENFLTGFGKKKQEIFLIDFGLAKRFRDPKTGEHIGYSDGKSLTGTAIYASIYTHLGIEQCRRDDLESLGYVLMYFLRGDLPWLGIKAKTREEKQQKIMELKISHTPDLLCKGFPEEFLNYFNCVRELQFEAKPDYDFFKTLFSGCMKKNDLVFDYNYDWIEVENDNVRLNIKNEISQILNKEFDLSKNLEDLKVKNESSVKKLESSNKAGGLFGSKKLAFNFSKKEENNTTEVKKDSDTKNTVAVENEQIGEKQLKLTEENTMISQEQFSKTPEIINNSEASSNLPLNQEKIVSVDGKINN